MSGCYDCLNTGTMLVCDECGAPSTEPRITPAMVSRLQRSVERRRPGWSEREVIDAWAARENKRANGGGQ